MPIRQELLTGINLIRHICRTNGLANGLANQMKDTKPYHGITDPEKDAPEGFANFEAHKESVGKLNDAIYELSGKINVVLQKADPTYLDSGINAIPVVANRQKITSDSQNLRSLTETAKPLIQITNAKQDLAPLAAPFESYISESGTKEPNPWQIIPVEAIHANILQSILSAMKYELQGLNENTGQVHGLSVEQIKARISSRIGVGWVYHSRLTDDPEPVGTPNKAAMGSVLSYIEQNLNSATSFIDLELLGQYISTYIPSVPSVRRWWAL